MKTSVPDSSVLIDVSAAGASGDMFLSALIDLLGDDQALVPVAASLLIYDPALRVRVISGASGAGSGKRLEIARDNQLRLSPVSMHGIVKTVSEELELSSTAKTLSDRALSILLEAESRVHDTPLESLHLHETGTIDTILDIVGTMYLLERAGLLGRARFLSTKVAVGSGSIHTEHGDLEVPVPAVAEILVSHDVPFHTGDAKTEVLTPTGAAILVTLANEYLESADGFIARKQGLGFGSRTLGTVPNAMRILIGERAPATEPPTEVAPPSKSEAKAEARKPLPAEQQAGQRMEVLDSWADDEVVVIEANVDDVDGEVMGNLFDTLLVEGLAYDVVMIPAFGKKNRPCFVVKVIAPKAGLKSVAAVMIRNLGTLGIRYTTWQRLKATREIVVCRLEIDDKEYMVRVKVARGLDGSVISIKPEADDVLKISAETGIPVRELKPRIAMQAHAVTE
ncbi:MAG: nickel pincer cofactor biosynthesis protein LarC [Candidatus Thorarchaeota archaeon]|nr:nickel pincer cofactor biosynthesis protein LarC [Candidatus Thorarchaeota archaeon]